MRRRECLNVIGAAISWSLSARAQEPQRVLGFLSGLSPAVFPDFLEGLKDAGFIEGRNLRIEYRFAAGQYQRLPSMAAELMGRDIAAIFCPDTPAALAAKAATSTIPIVFVIGLDPVKLGLVDSLSRPGGNITGVSILLSMLGPKRLELVRELLPAGMVALLVNPEFPNALANVPETQAAADALGLHLEVLTASTERDLEAVFATMVKQRVDALIVTPDPFLFTQRQRIVALAASHRVPAIYPLRGFVEVGGLMSYATPDPDLYRKGGTLAGRILRGDKPADLPIQQATKFELLINLKAAKLLRLTVPESLLTRADEVIE